LRKVDKLCEILTNYKKVIEQYKILNKRVFATAALREAKNKDAIVDQIKVRTGFSVEVFDDPEEKTCIYKEICRKLAKYTDFETKEALITSIGTGSIGVAAYSKGSILFNQTLKVGAMKLSEIFESVYESSSEFYLVLEEYLKGFTYVFNNLIPISDIHYFIGGRAGAAFYRRNVRL
jgi:Exopolyphosphatase